VAEIAEATVQHIGSGSVNFVDWPRERKVVEVGDAIISNQKIKDLLNWSPQYDLQKGLIETKAYYESCLDKYLR
jgi:UDP-glucose 4-epimerase